MSYVRQCVSSSIFKGSISFCDSSSPVGGIPKKTNFAEDELYNEMDDTSDVSALIPEPMTRITGVKPIIAVGNRRQDQPLCCSTSCPSQIPQCSGRVPKKPAYGSVPNDPENGQVPVSHVIYCVHGHPKGCCVMSNSDLDNNYNTSNPNKRKESYTATIVEDHCHQIRPTAVDKKARRKLIIASALCVLFMIGEVVGGILSSSLAIATDAAHLLTDFASFMISLFSLWVASRPPTRTMSFGWYRAEVIGALTSVLMIWVVTGILVYLAVERVMTRDFEIESTSMLITSAIGVIVNIVMGLTLHQHGHTHSTGHQHDTEAGHSDNQNINVRAAYIHVLGDFIQSFGVFIAALIIYFKPSWGLIDPICTFLFSFLVLITTFAILKDTMLVLMEGLPKGMDFVKVMNTFLQTDGVVRVHNLRIWALSMDKLALSAHLAICPGKSPQKILQEASQQIRSKFEFFEMTLQIEEFNENMEQCSQCKCPES